MVTLKNKQRRMRTFNLDSRFHMARRDNTPAGKPEVLTLLALERRKVEDAVLSCTEIKAARDAGTLRVYGEPKPKPESKPKSERKPPADKPSPKPASKKTTRRREED